MTYRIYGDSKYYYQVAEFNGLSNLKRLGTTVGMHPGNHVLVFQTLHLGQSKGLLQQGNLFDSSILRHLFVDSSFVC